MVKVTCLEDDRTETEKLIERLKGASCEEEPALRNRLAELHMRSARRVALRYRDRGLDVEDLVQVAYTALVGAAHRYDPRLGHEFLSYALPTVEGSIKRHFRDHGWSIRPPRRIQEANQRVTVARAELTQRLGRAPTVDEVADHADMDVELVIEALAAHDYYSLTSLDVPVGDEDRAGERLGDLLGSEDGALEAAEARLLVAPLVRRLGPRDRRIVIARFYEQRSQQDIADELGTSQMQISRLLSRIMRDLRAMLDAPGGPAPAALAALSGPPVPVPRAKPATPANRRDHTSCRGGAVKDTDQLSRQVEHVVRATRLIGAFIAESLVHVDPAISMPQWRVLVLASEGHANVSAVAADLHVHMSNATRMCDRLVSAGLLERRRSDTDRRNILLGLTEAGQRLYDGAMDYRRRRVKEAMLQMLPKERAELAASAAQFVRAGARQPMPDD